MNLRSTHMSEGTFSDVSDQLVVMSVILDITDDNVFRSIDISQDFGYICE